MKNLSLEEHRKRIENINSAEENNKKYFRRHRIRDYLPGQVTYYLGDYPAPFSIAPTQYDYDMIKELAENGVDLIQIHEEWNDSIRHLGADKYTSHDEEGLQKFVDLCHSFGIKVLPYISTGYFQGTDPDFREDFSRTDYSLTISHFSYRKCYAGSPSWREYLLPRTFAALDKYGFDGIYNDWGYDGIIFASQKALAEGKKLEDLVALEMEYDPEIEDLLGTIYTEVKRRGGVYKLHCDRNNAPPCKDKVYDYLWIGENVGDGIYGAGKDYEPYMVPCQHSLCSSSSPSSYFAKTIPFMQFPLLKRGRYLQGKGIEENLKFSVDDEYNHHVKVREYMKDHPNGPYVYSLWSAIPDDVNEYPQWCKYLALYKPMVTPNSIAYIELRECTDIVSSLPENVFASMFVNEEKYLVVSNLTKEDYELVLNGNWVNRENNKEGKSFTIKPEEIIFLKKA